MKSAFTRAYNKKSVVTPFSVGTGVKKASMPSAPDDMEAEEPSGEETEEGDDITKDAMITVSPSLNLCNLFDSFYFHINYKFKGMNLSTLLFSITMKFYTFE